MLRLSTYSITCCPLNHTQELSNRLATRSFVRDQALVGCSLEGVAVVERGLILRCWRTRLREARRRVNWWRTNNNTYCSRCIHIIRIIRGPLELQGILVHPVEGLLHQYPRHLMTYMVLRKKQYFIPFLIKVVGPKTLHLKNQDTQLLIYKT